MPSRRDSRLPGGRPADLLFEGQWRTRILPLSSCGPTFDAKRICRGGRARSDAALVESTSPAPSLGRIRDASEKHPPPALVAIPNQTLAILVHKSRGRLDETRKRALRFSFPLFSRSAISLFKVVPRFAFRALFFFSCCVCEPRFPDF